MLSVAASSPSRWRRLVSEERGWTLAELLVATMLGLGLLGVGTSVFTASLKSQPRATSRGADIQQARSAMERITRELRLGWSVPTATSAQLSILTYVNSASCGGAQADTRTPCRVTYTCSSTACTRVEANPDGSGAGAAETVVSGIAGPAVFSYAPSSVDPAFVGVTLSFPAEAGEDVITLGDGVALRNPGAPL